MKNFYFSLFLILNSIILIAQNNDFNNAGGDLLWSNTANWSLGEVPNTTNTGQVRLPLIVESLVDTDVTIKKIQTTFATPGDVAVAGTSTLTIDAGANAVFGIENLSDSNINLIFKGNVTINNSTTVSIANTLMRNQNGSTNAIVFTDGSLLTLTTPLEARTGSSNNFSYNGTLAGTAALRFNANTINTFGITSNNTGHEGDFVWVGANASVIVNSADNNTFLPADRKIQVNAINGSIEVNGANVFKGNISINGDRSFTFDMNKNQNSMGTIVFAGGSADGILNLDIDNSITELAFADNSASAWGAGILNITNFTEGVIRFGTDNAGLTAAQLSQIVVDNGGGPIALDSAGYLVNESSLSVDNFKNDALEYIAYPTLADSKLFFKKPQQNVKVFDLNGRMIIQNQSKSQTEIAVSSLNQGLYLIVFDNKIVEKFIKQ